MPERWTIGEIVRTYWIVLLAPWLLLAPIIIQGQVLFWGTPSLQFVPWWQYALECLRQGALPLWNPMNGMGAPLIANYQVAFFYPPNWLLLLFGLIAGVQNSATGVAWGYTLLTVLHLAWAGLGMAIFIRRLGFTWLGQVVGGLAYGLSGYIVGRLGFFSMTWVAAWLPWVMFFADQIASPVEQSAEGTTDRFRLLPGLMACFAMQLLAGHAQLTWYTILLSGLWVTVGSLRQGGLRRLALSWLSLAAAILLAACLAAVQLAPTFEYLRQSHRADAVAYDVAMTYSFWPWRFLTVLLPDFFGNPARGDFWGYATYWEDHIYAGMTPVLLALATAWLALRGASRKLRWRRWRLIGLLWVVIVASFMLALGKFTPIFPFLYRHIPTFAMFQAPARYLIWVAFSIPVLAAAGVDAWRCPTGKGLYWFRLGTAGAFSLTIGAGLAWIGFQAIRVTFIRATALAGLWAAGFGLLTLAIPLAERRGRVSLWQGCVIAWVLADLLFTGWSLNPGASADFLTGQSAGVLQAQAASGGQRIFISQREAYDLKFKRFMRFNDFNPLEDWRGMRDVLIPDLNLLDHVSTTNNFDPLVPDGYARWMDGIETQNPAAQQSWLAWMGVGAIEHIDGSAPFGVRFDPIQNAQRWHWSRCARSVSNVEAWMAMEQEWNATVTPDRKILLEDGAVSTSGGCATTNPPQVTWVSETPIRITMMIDASEDGWLELVDTWYPGWQAILDGKAARIYLADGAFQALSVPAGNHRIVLYYRPVGFYFGGLLSILVLLFCIFGWLRGNRQRAR